MRNGALLQALDPGVRAPDSLGFVQRQQGELTIGSVGTVDRSTIAPTTGVFASILGHLFLQQPVNIFGNRAPVKLALWVGCRQHHDPQRDYVGRKTVFGNGNVIDPTATRPFFVR